MIRYFDSSALVKRLVHESGSELVRALLAEGDAATSRYSLIEIISAVARRKREGLLSSAEVEAIRRDIDIWPRHFLIVEISRAVVEQAQNLLFSHSLRAGDSLQLGSCLVLQRELKSRISFICSDSRLLAAAAAEGLDTQECGT